MDNDILLEIADTDLPILRDIYKKYMPHAMHAYYWIDNYIDWKKRGITKIKFYCPEGRWDDGTFIAIEDDYIFTIFLFTLEESCERLKKALKISSRIKWSEPDFSMLFLAIHEDFLPIVLDEISQRGADIKFQDISNMWWIPKEDAIKYEFHIPDDVYIASLKSKDVAKIDAVWPHRHEKSQQYLLDLIIANGGFGLYSKKDDTLCAWIMRNNYGGMAILQTAEEHKRKGYGNILAKYFSKYWAEKGLDIFCFIMTHNKPSLNLFEKLGYRKEHGITWVNVVTK